MGRFLPFLIVFGGIIATLGFAPVLAGQDVDNAGKICDVQTAQQERRAGIPKDLLKAISLAETGRWDSAEQASLTLGGAGFIAGLLWLKRFTRRIRHDKSYQPVVLRREV